MSPALFMAQTAAKDDDNQLGVVAGPFGQMLQQKDVNSHRGSQLSVSGSGQFVAGKLYVSKNFIVCCTKSSAQILIK